MKHPTKYQLLARVLVPILILGEVIRYTVPWNADYLPFLLFAIAPYLALFAITLVARSIAPAAVATMVVIAVMNTACRFLLLLDGPSSATVGVNFTDAVLVTLSYLIGLISLVIGIIVIYVRGLFTKKSPPPSILTTGSHRNLFIRSGLALTVFLLIPFAARKLQESEANSPETHLAIWNSKNAVSTGTRDQFEFRSEISRASSPDERADICRKWFEHTSDFDLQRDIQDAWSINAPSEAMEYFRERHNRDYENPRGLYFLGRIQSSPIRRIGYGKDVIQRDPAWPYGYRLIVHTYLKYLFDMRGTPVDQEALQATLPADADFFKKFDEMETDREFAEKVMYRYYRFLGKSDLAAQRLEKGRLYGWSWTTAVDTLGRWEDASRFQAELPDSLRGYRR